MRRESRPPQLLFILVFVRIHKYFLAFTQGGPMMRPTGWPHQVPVAMSLLLGGLFLPPTHSETERLFAKRGF